MLIVVDRDRCVSAGLCAMRLPTVFAQDDSDGVVTLLQPNPDVGLLTQLREAVGACPSQAIGLTE